MYEPPKSYFIICLDRDESKQVNKERWKHVCKFAAARSMLDHKYSTSEAAHRALPKFEQLTGLKAHVSEAMDLGL